MEPVIVSLFGKKVFADMVKDVEMKSSWIRVDFKSNDNRCQIEKVT